MKLVFATPTVKRPHDAYLKALEDSVPALDALGIEHLAVNEVGNVYISNARSTMLRKAMDARADYVLFIDSDMSFTPKSLVKLIESQGDVVCGTYRYKQDEERYMGYFYEIDGVPCSRWPDGAIEADRMPAGFLKISKEAVDLFMKTYPDLCYGPLYARAVDLFNHGAHADDWWGEDYSFCRRWRGTGEKLWVVPDLDITHHKEDKSYPGNLHRFMLKNKMTKQTTANSSSAADQTGLKNSVPQEGQSG